MSFDLSKIEYIDIHSHLNFKDYKEDIENVFAGMKENKIATICIGTDLKESVEVRKIAEENENIFYSVGLHPHDNLEEFDFAFLNKEKYILQLKEIANSEKCVAIGECGLDYFYIYKDFNEGKISEEKLKEEIEKQKEVFKMHIDLAIELDLLLMLHIRPSEIDGNKEDAYLDAIKILTSQSPSQGGEKSLMRRDEIKVNFHFFVSTKNVLEKILENENWTVSVPAVCTFTEEYNEMIKAIPLHKIHIETDSPFVMPKNRRKFAKRNEPSFVMDVFDKICEIKGITSTSSVINKEEFKEILKQNFKNVFLK